MKSADMDELSKWIKGMDLWSAVLKENYKDVMPITMTWALKLKAKGFEQIPNVHYDPNSKSSPVTTQAAIFMAFMILMMNKCYVARVIDVKGVFLKGKFASEDEKLMLEVLQGFCWVYDKLCDEVEAKQKCGQAMLSEEVMKRAKVIFCGVQRLLVKSCDCYDSSEHEAGFQEGVPDDGANNIWKCAGSILDRVTKGISRHKLH
jgi:hypothetical protein